MRIRFLLLLTFALSALTLKAQNISVADFYLAENDLTARLHGTSVIDQNGYVCALIKVKTTERGIWQFDVGMMGVRKMEEQNAAHPAEIWVYVPFGVNWISIQHDKLGELEHYVFPCSIDKGCTYVMKLTTGKVKTYIEEETTEQWLVFEITPHNAILEVDNKMWPVSAEGTARKMMPFGTYTYRVQAQNYHSTVGKVKVNDPENSHVVPVKLEPNFGWIEVPGDNGLRGAAVYVDNALIGKAPCKTEALKSGQHDVRILKEMYEPYTTTVTVKDNETTTVAPMLASDFAHLTLQVDADAEIWVNDERKGTRSWTGDLRTGTYRIECKQKGHESTTTKITVNNGMNGETIHLEAPIPIYGSLNVECTPDLAMLYIDGKEMGKAPKLIGKMLVGEHEIRLSKKGYTDYTETVTITQGQRTQVNATLTANNSTLTVTQPEKPKQLEQPKTEQPKLQQPITPKPKNSVFFAMANFAYSVAPQLSYGATFGMVKRVGWFVTAASNFSFDAMNYSSTCDVNGYVGKDYPDYTGESCSTRLSAMAGLVVRIGGPVCLKVGAGYGSRVKSWYTADGNLVKYENNSINGLDATAGVQLHLKGFTMSADVVTTNFKTLEYKIGLGLCWKKKK